MLILRTGLPGASKTLTTIHELCSSEHAGVVPFFYNNIKYFCLDLDAVSSFGVWLINVYLPDHKDSKSITDIVSNCHQAGRLINSDDLPQLITEYENWRDSTAPKQLYLKWAKVAYKGNKHLQTMLSYCSDFPSCSLEELKRFNLHWQYFSDPSTWFNLPHPCQIVLDECQRTFPPRPNGSKVPRHVSEFETHRHLGTDIYLITQDAKLLDSNVRRLAGRHIHLVNLLGSKRVRRMEWPEASDPSDYHSVKSSVKTIINHPKQLYGVYFSALKHTHKLNIPLKVFVPFFFMFVAAYAIYFLFSNLTSDKTQTSNITSQSAQQSTYSPPEADFNVIPIDTIPNPLPGCSKLGFSGFNFVKNKWIPYFNCFKDEQVSVTIDKSTPENESEPFIYSYQANQLVTPEYLAIFGYQIFTFQNMLLINRKNQIFFVTFMD